MRCGRWRRWYTLKGKYSLAFLARGGLHHTMGGRAYTRVRARLDPYTYTYITRTRRKGSVARGSRSGGGAGGSGDGHRTRWWSGIGGWQTAAVGGGLERAELAQPGCVASVEVLALLAAGAAAAPAARGGCCAQAASKNMLLDPGCYRHPARARNCAQRVRLQC